MISSAWNALFRALNWSPFLHTSTDKIFGSIDTEPPDRFSLIEFSLGKRKTYVLSFVKTGSKCSFKFFDHINFDDLCPIVTEVELQHKIDAYKKYLSNKNNEEVRNLIEFLQDKIGMNQSATVSGYNKINLYTAIILVYMGFIAYLLSKVAAFEGEYSLYQYSMYLLIAISIYYTLNCSLFIKAALSIKGYIRSTFQDLKEDPSLKKLACAYYTDWYATNNESWVITSIVANVEKYFTRSFFISLSICFILFFVEHATFSVIEVDSHNGEYLVFDGSGKFQESEFLKLLSNINKSSDNIYIVSNKDYENGSVVSGFIKSAISKPERVIEIDFKNDIIDSQTVLIKYKE